MAIQINLLQNQKDYNKLDNYFRLFRLSVAIGGTLCLVALIVIFSLKRNVFAQRDASLVKVDALQAEINSLQEQEARIIIINEKMKAMLEILQATPDHAREVETFFAYAPQATESGSLRRISLNGKTADVILSFADALELSRFLTTIESPTFQDYFSSLTVQTLELSASEGELVLNLNATFK